MESKKKKVIWEVSVMAYGTSSKRYKFRLVFLCCSYPHSLLLAILSSTVLKRDSGISW